MSAISFLVVVLAVLFVDDPDVRIPISMFAICIAVFSSASDRMGAEDAPSG
ncbi:hypothetical protein JYT83_00390 [bacterium AH-315-F18]|nr:hypothetical protein [bacterium AH-315-F18]